MSNSSQSSWNVQWKVVAAFAAASIIPFVALIGSTWTGPSMLTSIGVISSIVVLLMGLLIGWGLLSGTTRQARALNQALAKINEGDFEARVQVLTQDELGQSAEALNVMCDNTLNLLQSKNQQGQLQESIESLIAQMECIAAGDLTIAAKNNGDITGAVADSVNNMTAQLRTIVEQVQHATEHVSASAIKMRDDTTRVTTENDQRANEIRQTSQQLLEMTDAFQSVAALTEESAQVAVEARHTASEGRKAVDDTVEGMQRIRTQVQNTSKRIKRLGESSQEIGEIVQLISDIADRTSVLALNASIQAAMAGEAGQGFAVVAEEVERLAERSTDATGQIAKLIRGIQTETGQAISDMEESTREVVAGSSLATQASQTLGEIDGVSNQLVDLIQSVSSSARSHAQQSEKIAATMAQVSDNTRQSAETNREVTRSVNQLARMADSLRSSVSRFNVGKPSPKELPVVVNDPQTPPPTQLRQTITTNSSSISCSNSRSESCSKSRSNTNTYRRSQTATSIRDDARSSRIGRITPRHRSRRSTSTGTTKSRRRLNEQRARSGKQQSTSRSIACCREHDEPKEERFQNGCPPIANRWVHHTA